MHTSQMKPDACPSVASHHPAAYVLCLLVVFGLCAMEMRGQTPEFTQFGNLPVLFNPAFAGQHEEVRVALSHRNQWQGAHVSTALATDQYVQELRGGLSILALHDNQGDVLREQQYQLAYSYKWRLHSKWMLSAAPQLIVAQRSLEWSQPNCGDQIYSQYEVINVEPELPGPRLTRIFATSGLGVLLNSRRFYAGAAIRHLLSTRTGFFKSSEQRQQPLYTLQLGYTFTNPNSPWAFGFHVLGQKQQIAEGLLLTSTAQYRWFQLGVGRSYEHGGYLLKAAIVRPRFRVGYSYDNARLSSTIAMNSHEVAVQYRFNANRGATVEPRVNF